MGKPEEGAEEGLRVVYKLVLTKEGASIPIYVGKTKDAARRFKEHASRKSACRLVRNAFRKYGRKHISLEVILRCRASDADANEAFWIEKLNTLRGPYGCNVSRGCSAGEDTNEGALMPSISSIVPFEGDVEEVAATAEAWTEVSVLLQEANASVDEDEQDEERDETERHPDPLKELLRMVHPDRAGDRTFSSQEMTSTILELLKRTTDR